MAESKIILSIFILKLLLYKAQFLPKDCIYMLFCQLFFLREDYGRTGFLTLICFNITEKVLHKRHCNYRQHENFSLGPRGKY